MIKYSFESHLFEIIEYCDFYSLDKRERYWQDYYNVLGENGMNCKLTQCEGKKAVLSIEARKKISDKVKINQPMRRQEMKDLFSKIFTGKNNPMYNKKGLLNHASKMVLNLSNGIFYECIREASQSMDIKYSTLKSMLNGANRNKTSLIILE